jgi:trk system potassium uptake protein TrkH
VIRAVERFNPGLNWRLIVPVVSGTVMAVGLCSLLCVVVALIGDGGGVLAFGLTAAGAIPVALLGLVAQRRLRTIPMRARDGFAAVTLAWLAACVWGALPFLLTDTFGRPLDAFFESVSGLTTTGATLIPNVEDAPDAVIFWRSLSQWLGGVGIVVLVVAIAPATGLASQRVFFAETSGVTADRMTPRIADTAKIIWGIYLAITVLGFLAYWIAGMGPWDAINHAFTSVATGGHSTRTASIGAFDSLPIELVCIALMWLSGVNFAFYWLALRGRDHIWPQAAEVRAYLLITVLAVATVTATLLANDDYTRFWEAVRHGTFATVSVMTSTGYTTEDFDQWDDFARITLLGLMFIGACAGSTAGGMKVIRVMLLAKSAGQEIQRQLQPKAVHILRIRGRVFPEEARRGVLGFDIVTAVAGSAATLNIVGPSLGELGASESYAAVSDGGRAVLIVLMFIGRLEIFTVLVLLTPAFWRRNVA